MPGGVTGTGGRCGNNSPVTPDGNDDGQKQEEPPAPVPTETNIAPTDLHSLAPKYIDENNVVHVPPDADAAAKMLDGMKIPTPTLRVEDGKFQLDFGKPGEEDPLKASIGVTVQDGHTVVDVSSNSLLVPDSKVERLLQKELDKVTGGRPVTPSRSTTAGFTSNTSSRRRRPGWEMA